MFSMVRLWRALRGTVRALRADDAADIRRTHSNDLEPLEGRVLLSGDAGLAAQLLAEGFQPMLWQGEEVHVRPGHWIVQFDGLPGRAAEQLQRVNAMLGQIRPDLQATRHLGQPGLVLVEAPPQLPSLQLQTVLQKVGGFRFMEPDAAVWINTGVSGGPVFPNDPSFGSLWGLHNTGQSGGLVGADISAPMAWTITTGSPEVVVAVIDSGVDYNHPDLRANMWVNPYADINKLGRFINDVHGWDFRDNNSDPMDLHWHGTHVAGTIAAAGNNARGVTGVAWNVKIMALRFLGPDGKGVTSRAIEAINYATLMRAEYGVNVVLSNNSWGSDHDSTALREAIRFHGDAGILFVAAAGNDGQNIDRRPTAHYPASYDLPNLIAVAATDRHDGMPGWSNYGRRAVHLGAPGAEILSTYVGGGYATASGTSMAAPHVAGVAALAWSLRPDATVAQVKSAILDGVDPVASMNGVTSTGGRLNAYATLQLLLPATLSAPGELTAVPADDRVNVQWEAVAGAQGYRLQRAVGDAAGEEDWQLLAEISQSGFADVQVEEATTYSYRVQAYNVKADSAWSDAVVVQLPLVAPVSPAGLAATAVSSDLVELTWELVPDATAYRIERTDQDPQSGDWQQVGTTPLNLFQDESVDPDTTYHYRVIAVKQELYSTPSEVLTIITPLAPGDPQLLPGDANGDGRVDGEDFLIWQASFGIQSDATWEMGDFNGDGRVDGEDFLIWQANFGRVGEQEEPAVASTFGTSDPEPSLRLMSRGGILPAHDKAVPRPLPALPAIDRHPDRSLHEDSLEDDAPPAAGRTMRRA